MLKYSDQVELLLPEELYGLIWKEVEARLANIRYYQVVMSLSDLLEADFFNIYIKTGIFLFSSFDDTDFFSIYFPSYFGHF